MSDQQLIEQVIVNCCQVCPDSEGVSESYDTIYIGLAGYLRKDFNPLANTPEGRSQAIELAEKYQMWVNFMEFVVLAPRSDGSYIRVPCNYDSWQRAVCKAAVQIENEKVQP